MCSDQPDPDPEMAGLVAAFVAELPDRMDAIESAWRQGRTEDLRRLAHQLKGASAGYGFPDLGHDAAALERELCPRGQTSPDRVDEGARTLLDHCRRIMKSRRAA
jgi:HPt (histidine-containing phosphotransfer) domain-containing protein